MTSNSLLALTWLISSSTDWHCREKRIDFVSPIVQPHTTNPLTMPKRYVTNLLCGDGLIRPFASPNTPEEALEILQLRSRDEDHGYKTPCRVWVGCTCGKGYGHLRYQGRLNRTYRLMWVLSNGPIQARIEVCHDCNTYSCHRLDHLWLGTHQDNMKHAGRHGLVGFIKGEDHYEAKLTAAKVLWIRSVRDVFPNKEVADMFNVSDALINKIHKRLCWKSV